jgi:ribosomal protein S18 acetylase RimI-like enzyme
MVEQQVAKPRVAVHDMNPTDVDHVVDVHCRAFPEYLLTHMGRRYLRYYYSSFLNGKSHYAMVAQIGDHVVGFVAGTADIASLHSRVYRAGITTTLDVAGRFFYDPVLRRQLIAKRRHLSKSLQTVASNGHSAPAAEHSGVSTRLLSIGVSPDAQRMGVAQALVSGFCSKLHADGIDMVGLSVRNDNYSGIQFYDRTGWQRERADANGIYYIRSTAL